MENITEGVPVLQTSKPGVFLSHLIVIPQLNLPLLPSPHPRCVLIFLTVQWDAWSKETLEMTGAVPPTPVITSAL